MICTDHFLQYEKQCNVDFVYDLSHEGKNCSRTVLKKAGLWSHCIVMSAASNCVYGSTLSPPRLAQLRESVQSWLLLNSWDCEIFQYYLPHIVRQNPAAFPDLAHP
eukprot:10599623-Karenia_brevis.AAC.1